MEPDYRRMRKGDRIKLGEREGTLLTKPEYRTTPTSGLFYADVQWDDGTEEKNMMICLTRLEWYPAEDEPEYREDQRCQGFYCGAAPLGCHNREYCPREEPPGQDAPEPPEDDPDVVDTYSLKEGIEDGAEPLPHVFIVRTVGFIHDLPEEVQDQIIGYTLRKIRPETPNFVVLYPQQDPREEHLEDEGRTLIASAKGLTKKVYAVLDTFTTPEVLSEWAGQDVDTRYALTFMLASEY